MKINPYLKFFFLFFRVAPIQLCKIYKKLT